MADNTLLNLAKQGKPGAIAALLNQSFQKEGWSFKASLKDVELKLILEGKIPPSLEKIRDRLHRGLANIKPEGIEIVAVEARKTGETESVWQEKFSLKTGEKIFTKVEATPVDLSPLPAKKLLPISPSLISTSTETELQANIWKLLWRYREIGYFLVLVLIASVLMTGFGEQRQARSTLIRWEYRIESFEDSIISMQMDRLGVEGWEMVSARRALSGEDGSRRGLYECIFKRPLGQSAKPP